MPNAEKEPRKKKVGLYDNMGLDQRSEKQAPPAPQPGIFPGSAEGELNERANQNVSTRIQDKLKARRGEQNGRTF